MVRFTAGLRKPKHQILGADVAGRVAAVGRNVTQFQVGDAVFGDLSDSGYGAFAEYVAAPAHAVTLKPARMTFAEWLRLTLAEKDVTVTALHRATGLSLGRLAAYLSAKKPDAPTLESARRICRALGVRMDSLDKVLDLRPPPVQKAAKGRKPAGRPKK